MVFLSLELYEKSSMFFSSHLINEGSGGHHSVSLFNDCYRIYNMNLRHSIFNEFRGRSYRKNPNYYTYMLMYSNLLRDLLLTKPRPITGDVLRAFGSCCFYVGKGCGRRKISHLFDGSFLLKNGIETDNKKLNKIMEVWDSGEEVSVLIVGQDRNHYEAASREFSLKRTLGLNELSNVNEATFYGEMKKSWSEVEIINFGQMMLSKALESIIDDWPPFISKNHLLGRKRKAKPEKMPKMTVSVGFGRKENEKHE